MRSLLLSTSAVALAAALLLAQTTPLEAQTTRVQGVVNVNLATADELQMLPGIGPARAAAIIEYRKQHGAFARVEDLLAVSGIGAKALERIRAHCVITGKTTAQLERGS